jgi:hypothetical protein
MLLFARDVLPQLKSIKPKLPVLIMSIHPEDHYAVRVIKSGAAGYLSKDLAPDELVTAVKTVVGGKKYITPTIPIMKTTFIIGFGFPPSPAIKIIVSKVIFYIFNIHKCN